MLAAQWMNETFPDDDYTPQRSSVPESSGLREPLRTSIRAPTYFIEEHSREARFQFVRQRPVKTVGAALKEIGRGLSEALRTFDLQPRSRGGQEPLLYRHYTTAPATLNKLRRIGGGPAFEKFGRRPLY